MMDDKERLKGRIICDNKRDLIRRVSSTVTGFKSFTTCDGMNALYFMYEERDALTAFDERLQKFVSSSSESLVGGTHTS